jgi:nitrite reductase (NADH) small subunit
MKAGSDTTYSVPPPAKEVVPDTTLVRVCRLADIPMAGARVWRRGDEAGGDIALFRTGADRVFAVRDRCPHKGGPLSQGIVFGDRVACPLHNWTIDLASGCATAPDHGCAATFQVRINGGVVYIGVDT